MNEQALSLFIEQVLVDAERKFGPEADPVWLESYAREAVLDLWLETPEITFFTAYKAFLQLREEIAMKASPEARAFREVQNRKFERPAVKPRISETPPRLRTQPYQPQTRQGSMGSVRDWKLRGSKAG